MPRVGSSTIRIFGLQRKPAREHDLLLIAAREIVGRLVGARHADLELTCDIVDEPPLAPLVDKPAAAELLLRGDR